MAYIPTILGSGVGGYAFLKRTQEDQQAAYAKSPEIMRDLDHLQANIETVETVDDLLEDRQLLRVALSAFGLQDDINNTGFLRQVLDSDLNDSRSFANRLSDKTYFAFARSFNFNGTPQLPNASNTDAIADTLATLGAPEDLFLENNAGLLTQALEAFGIEQDAERTVFLQRVVTSDLEDPNALANRLDNAAYLSFARAVQGGETPVDAAFLRTQSDEMAARLAAVGSAEDLVSDRGMLRATLDVFGLTEMADNTYFLQSVLESDLDDPDSFANRQRDPRLAEMAAAFDFHAREASGDSIYGFAALYQDKLTAFPTADALLADDEALTAALTVFDLQDDPFLASVSNLRAVLDSDTYDESSFANSLEDPRYSALAKLFAFNEIAEGEEISTAQKALADMVTDITNLSRPIETGDQLTDRADLMITFMNFFDLPTGVDGTSRYNKIATSDPDDPNSYVNLTTDTRYRAFFDAMDFQTADDSRSYPPGFVNSLSEAYLTRQFEVAVGGVDNSMRVAISLERQLDEVVNTVSSTDARWYSVMSSTPLRTVFEAAFGFPSSFAALDLDRQLEDFKARSQQILGTDDLQEILDPEILDRVRDTYLGTTTGTTQSGYSASETASLLLSNSAQSDAVASYGSALSALR